MARSSAGNGCLTIFSLPFAGVGVFMLYLLGAMFWKSYSYSQWPVTPATILTADLKTNYSSDGSTQEVVATYRYEWEGQEYEGDRVRLGKSSDNVGSFHRRKAELLQEAMRKKQMVDVHVNPANPDESILFPEIRWEMVGFYSLLVVLFGGAGFGLLIYSIKSRSKASAMTERQTTAPGQPWTWNEKWTSGEIFSGNRTGAWFMTGFTVFWNLVSLPVLFAFQKEFLEKGNKPFLIAMLFPVIGFFMIIVTVYLWIRINKYGRCSFVMQQIPGVIGGKLTGAIRIPKGLFAPDGVDISLRNVRKITTGSGKNRSTREVMLWEEVSHQSQIRTGPTGEALLPVHVEIPYDCLEYDETNPSNQIVWTLQARAKTPGVDFLAEFDVPVFKTAQSDPDFKPTQRPAEDLSQPQAQEGLFEEEHIRVDQASMGGKRLVFPMMRHKGYAIGLLIFTLIWNGVVYGIWISPAPAFLFYIFGHECPVISR